MFQQKLKLFKQTIFCPAAFKTLHESGTSAGKIWKEQKGKDKDFFLQNNSFIVFLNVLTKAKIV